MNEYYQSPLSQRYASKEMQALFSNDKKFTTWRKLWIALAESEKELGLDITEEQIEELKAHALDINYDVAKAREKEVRHDVMSHVYAYGVQCPKAKGIIRRIRIEIQRYAMSCLYTLPTSTANNCRKKSELMGTRPIYGLCWNPTLIRQ